MGAVVSGVMGEGKGFLMPDAGEMPPRNMGTGLGLGNMPRGPSCVSQGKDTHAGMMSSKFLQLHAPASENLLED